MLGICSGVFAFKLSQDRNIAPERRLLALLERDRNAGKRGSGAAVELDAEGASAMSEIQKLLSTEEQKGK